MTEDSILERPVRLPWLIALIVAPPIGAYNLVSDYLGGSLFLGGNPGSSASSLHLTVAEAPDTAKWLVVVGILALSLFEIVALMKLNRFISKTGEYERPQKRKQCIGEELAGH